MANEKIQKILADKLEETARELKLQSEKMTKRAYQAETLFQMSQQLAQVSSLDEMYGFITEVLSEMFGALQVAFLNYEQGKLRAMAIKGLDMSLKEKTLDIDDKAILIFHDHGGIIRVSEAREGPIAELIDSAYKAFGFEPSIVINRFAGDDLANVIFIGPSLTLKTMQDEDIKTLSVFMEHAGKALYNLQLFSSLKEEKEKLQTAIENMSDGLIFVDTELNILIINQKAKDMLSHVQILERGGNIFAALKAFNINTRIEEILLREGDQRFELSMPQEGIVYMVISSKIKDARGSITGMMMTLKNISEERYTERLKTVFMSTISHKLRTPLTIIQGGVSLLNDGLLGELNLKQKDVVKTAFAQIQYLISLVNSLLKFTKTETDLMSIGLHKDRYNIDEVFQDLLLSMKEQFGRKKITVSFDIQDKSLNIYFDKDRLQSAIGNILDNAVKFNPEGSKVDIVVRQDNSFSEISISDNGAGIPKRYLAHLFQSFTQVDMDFTGQVKGMGLGLYLAHKIIKAHGGDIVCESQLGKGTTFIIRLPII